MLTMDDTSEVIRLFLCLLLSLAMYLQHTEQHSIFTVLEFNEKVALFAGFNTIY